MRTVVLLVATCFSLRVAAQPTSHAVVAELGGSGGFLSVNYEHAHSAHMTRVGVGFIPLIGPAVNASATGRLGNLELGGGVIVAMLIADASIAPMQAALVGSGVLAYRWRMGADERTFFRVAFTPLFNSEGDVQPWAGISVGTRLGH